MLFRRLNSFFFSIITKQVMQSLRSSYVPSPELTKLKPYLQPSNISSLYQLLSQSKSFNNKQIEQTLKEINVLNSSETSDEDKHASSRIKMDLSQIVIKSGDLLKAKEYLQDGLDTLRTMQHRQDIQEAMFLRRLGEVEIMNKDNHELALQHLLLSIKLFEQYTEDEQIHMSTAFGHLGPLHSLIAWYYLLHNNPQKAKQYTQLAIPYFLKVPYNHNDFEHMMCTRISALIQLGEIEQMRIEAKSVIKRTIDVSNKIWFLNVLVQNGFVEHTQQLQTTLNRIKQKLTPQKFQQYKKSMNICI